MEIVKSEREIEATGMKKISIPEPHLLVVFQTIIVTTAVIV